MLTQSGECDRAPFARLSGRLTPDTPFSRSRLTALRRLALEQLVTVERDVERLIEPLNLASGPLVTTRLSRVHGLP
jgi:hypothetical protein